MRRRLFVDTVVSAALVTAGLPRAVQPIPVLHGDGSEDDAPALQAVFDGRPVWHRGRVITGTEDVVLTNLRFRLGVTVHTRQGRRSVLITRCVFDFRGSGGDLGEVFRLERPARA